MRFLRFQAHCIILVQTHFLRLFLPGHIEPQRLQMPNASFSNQSCHHRDPSAGTGQIPSIQPAVPHQSNRVTRWALKHWAEENIWKCLLKAVNYFTDNKINNNWRIMGVNFKALGGLHKNYHGHWVDCSTRLFYLLLIRRVQNWKTNKW